jgi:endonuclease YncB( thermonuclease family)
MKIRLASIDAPETAHGPAGGSRPGQPYGESAKRFLSALVKGRDVAAVCYETDRYGRAVCDITVDGQSVNAQLVRSGMAWANEAAGSRYLRDRGLIELQDGARRAKRGLWSEQQTPTPPWVWRAECWGRGACSAREVRP